VNRCFAFLGLLLFVAAVSLYDGYLVLENQDVIAGCEENPVCRYLIRIDGGGVSLLLRSKALGTSAALLVMLAVWLRNKQLALPVAAVVAAFQLALLLYLTLDVPRSLFDRRYAEAAASAEAVRVSRGLRL
jgi:hypothetical protein